MKKALVVIFIAGLAVAAFAGTAHANDEVDANGLYKEPVCRRAVSIKSTLKTIAGQEPTGITASNAKWDMEIYLDKAEGDWSLVAKDKSPDAPPRELCVIAKGMSTSPYSQQKWYISDFKSAK